MKSSDEWLKIFADRYIDIEYDRGNIVLTPFDWISIDEINQIAAISQEFRAGVVRHWNNAAIITYGIIQECLNQSV